MFLFLILETVILCSIENSYTKTFRNKNKQQTAALDLLDEAGAIAQLDYHSSLDFDKEDDYDDEDDIDDPIVTVDEHTVASVISEWSGIPMGKLETKEMDRLQILEDELGRRVKGQGRAVRGVARAIRRARAGLRDPNRPVASFLFCGPTGTGTCGAVHQMCFFAFWVTATCSTTQMI